MSEISARCFLFVGNISATICKNLIFKIFYLVRKVFLICAKSDIGHMAYDSTSWRNCIRLLQSGQIKVQPMITHRLGLSQWQEGFDKMAKKEAIKVIFHYDYED